MPKPRATPLPPLSMLRDTLRYEPDTGAFYWTERPRHYFRSDLTFARYHAFFPGTRAETHLNNGYQNIRITVHGQRYCVMASWAAWILMTGEWPKDEVDHRNRNRHDNAWANLRQADGCQNKWNVRRALPSTGIRGVRISDGKYQVSIQARHYRHDIGRFESLVEAAAAYTIAQRELHGEFANHQEVEAALVASYRRSVGLHEGVPG